MEKRREDLKASGEEENSPSPFYAPMQCLVIKDDAEGQAVYVDVILEERFDLFLNNNHISTFFASPYELEELVHGFLVCEGFLEPGTPLKTPEVTPNGIFCNISIDHEELSALKHQQRCGTTSYSREIRHIDSDVRTSKEAIFHAVEQLSEKGEVWHRTGGAHTSMICNIEGEVLFFSEDVGRACSVDKVVGKALLHGTDLSRCILVTTGRLASTMVRKAANAGIPVIASKGATVREAVELARETGMTLLAFVRRPKMFVYSGEERIVTP